MTLGLHTEPNEYLLDLETDNMESYQGRITGWRLFWERDIAIFYTTDDRVMLYDLSKQSYWEIEGPEDLAECLEDDELITEATTVGWDAVVDL